MEMVDGLGADTDQTPGLNRLLLPKQGRFFRVILNPIDNPNFPLKLRRLYSEAAGHNHAIILMGCQNQKSYGPLKMEGSTPFLEPQESIRDEDRQA